MGIIDDAIDAADSVYSAITDNAATRQLDEWGKAVGVSTLTDPIKAGARAVVSSDAGLFISRVWATHAYGWFTSPQAYLMLGPAAPALGAFALAAPSLAKGETSFGRAYAQHVVWALNMGAKILGAKGIDLPAPELAKVLNADAELVRVGAEKIAQMKAYGVDVEALSRQELARIVGTDRIDLAYLARAAALESPADLERAAQAQAAELADLETLAAANAETERLARRAQAVQRGQAIIERAERVAEGQAIIDAAAAASPVDFERASSAPKRSFDWMLGAVVVAAGGALAWWWYGEQRRAR